MVKNFDKQFMNKINQRDFEHFDVEKIAQLCVKKVSAGDKKFMEKFAQN